MKPISETLSAINRPLENLKSEYRYIVSTVVPLPTLQSTQYLIRLSGVAPGVAYYRYAT